MLDEIKKSIIEDVDAEINSIEEAINEYTIRQQQISESICTKVGIFDRVFNTKKYKQKVNNDSLLRKEETNINNQVRIKQSELKSLIEKKEIIKKISDIEKLPFKNNEELRNYCADKSIQITSEDYFKYFREEVSKNDTLMLSFVKENLSYLKYDETNSVQIYKYFLSEKIKEFEGIKGKIPEGLQQQAWQYELVQLPLFNELIKLLDDNSVSKDFKNHITEWIRYKCDSFISFKEMSYLYNNDFDKLHEYQYLHSVPQVLDVKKLINLYQSDYGQELERIYKDDNYMIGMHGTNYITDSIEDNEIFKKGIRNSKQSDSIRCLDRTVAYNLPFFELLDYDGAMYAPGANLPYNYIITIPKEIYYSGSPIWGSKDVNSNDNYLLPEFVYGVYDREKLIRNNLPDKEKYDILYADYSNEPIYFTGENKSVSKK